MAGFVNDLLRNSDEIVIHNPDDNAKLYATKHLSAWLKESDKYISSGHTLISPGGAAREAGVTRQQIFSWCYISRKLTCFVCRPDGLRRAEESYSLVDLDQAKEIAANVVKRR